MSTIAPPRPRSRHQDATKSRRTAPLAAYTDASGARHELVCIAGAAGTTLVIDRPSDGIGEIRLLAHLATDEPRANAALIARTYLASPRLCRSLTLADLEVPSGEGELFDAHAPLDQTPSPCELADRRGAVYELEAVRSDSGIAQLRWTRGHGDGGLRQVVSVRAVVGALESYEPVLSLTRAAVACHDRDASVSAVLLRAELERATTSPIVLNRGLREAVERLTAQGEVSASEIAIRCGRVRRDPRGHVSGETSWLARRIGQVPEPGASDPTPWVHSDVLALIARAGLSLNPNEVEV
jgi:hypothetical protein